MADLTVFPIPQIPNGYNKLGKKLMIHDLTEPEATSTKLINFENLLTTSVTYAELVNLITNNLLIEGGFYLLTNFVTIYDQMDFDNTGSLKPTLITKTSTNVEEIWVLALSSNQIADRAYSKTYPNDKIQYDWTYNTTFVNGSPAKGRISERIDENNNRTDYDHREIKFIRYDDGAGNFTVINDNGNASQEFLTFVQNFTGGTVKDNWLGDFYSIGALYGQEYANNVFAGGFVVSNNSSSLFYNNTFSSYVNNNTFSGGVNTNTFSGDVNNNTFSGNVNRNTFSSYVYSNTFSGGDVYSNTFSNYVQSNTFSGGEVYSNTFSNDVYNNTFSGNVYSNTFSDNVANNTFSSGVNNNTFSGDVNSNTFSGSVSNNTFSGNVNTSTFNGSVNTNTFSGNVNTSTFSGNMQNNTISVVVGNTFFNADFNNNHFNGGVDGNTFSGYVYNNTFSGYVYNNTFSGYVYNNTFSGGDVYSNTFSNYVRSNTFSGYIFSNTFNGYVRSNTFNDNVYNNTFSGNVYSNTFTSPGFLKYVTIADALLNKTINNITYPFLFNTDYKKEILQGSNGSNYIRYFDGTNDINTLIP